MTLEIEVKVIAGSHVMDCAVDMIALADQLQMMVTSKHRGALIRACPGNTIEEVIAHNEMNLKKQREKDRQP